MFIRYDLRTIDVDAARSFYADALGIDFAGSDALAIWPLHEQARARGAPPHWLGQLGTSDLEATLTRFVEAGAERLGPMVQPRDGTAYQTLRDPFGAVVALRASTQASARPPVAWHHLHTRDVERAWPFYAETFSWKDEGTFDGLRRFGWGGTPMGTMADTALLPGVHPHWLYYFPVADLAAATEKIHASGGEVFTKPAALPNGARLVACHDPQRAAFGLVEPR